MNALTEHHGYAPIEDGRDYALQPTQQQDPMMALIQRVVTDPEASVEKLERMWSLKVQMDEKRAATEFAAALSMARADIPPIIKDAAVDYSSKGGGRTHYQHETLAGIAKTIDPILARYGLGYRFRTEQGGNGGVRVTCIISHAAGHTEETSLQGLPDTSGSKNSFQAVGSAVTYLQRYTLKAALGLSAEKDDDGQAADTRNQRNDNRQRQNDNRPNGNGNQQRQQHREPSRDQPPNENAPASHEAIEQIFQLVELTGSNLSAMLDHIGAKSVDQITFEQAFLAISLLQKKQARMAEAQSQNGGDYGYSNPYQ